MFWLSLKIFNSKICSKSEFIYWFDSVPCWSVHNLNLEWSYGQRGSTERSEKQSLDGGGLVQNKSGFLDVRRGLNLSSCHRHISCCWISGALWSPDDRVCGSVLCAWWSPASLSSWWPSATGHQPSPRRVELFSMFPLTIITVRPAHWSRTPLPPHWASISLQDQCFWT